MRDVRPFAEKKITLILSLFEVGNNLTKETALLTGGDPCSGLVMGDTNHIGRLPGKVKTAGKQLDMPVFLWRDWRDRAEKTETINPAGEHFHHPECDNKLTAVCFQARNIKTFCHPFLRNSVLQFRGYPLRSLQHKML